MKNQYFVYIMANIARTIYVGVTNDLERRVYEHKMKLVPGFTSKYKLDMLVYFEAGDDIVSGITREKQIKGWLRKKKVALIESMNPGWRDLSADLFEQHFNEAEQLGNPSLLRKDTDPSLRSG